jgi:catalase
MVYVPTGRDFTGCDFGVPFAMATDLNPAHQDVDPARVKALLDELQPVFPEHQPGTRPLHAFGTGAIGWFRPSDVAAKYCRARHFVDGETPVLVRFSNGNGQADPDGRLQQRGMAIRFHIGGTIDDGGRIVQRDATPIEPTDLLTMSAPAFFVNDLGKALEFERASKAVKVRRPSLFARLKSLITMCPLPPQEQGVTRSGADAVLKFANGYPPSQGFAIESMMMRLPASYARTMYHAVHAFEMTGPDGTARMVRFFIEPAAGIRAAGPPEPSGSLITTALRQPKINGYGDALPERYLGTELRDRLAHGSARFNLRMQIADPWDDTADPTKQWPPNRQRVLLGTITVDSLVADQLGECEELSYNPGRLVDGLAISDDPILAARVSVYETSYTWRMEARGAPVSASECPVTRHRATESVNQRS